ncbi:hypothetical protein [Phenylobacterium sp.]|uniref:hypothetical protein n=1 Tax=Phenylobacterium sp. TaxID=1871053 RepID=UPI00121496D4|nr:hypothetical protein [Phenylobacterium sp.]THD59414.1 MAG: hypothetical protein E8A49_16495 [Phenylobacterium sp.]
MSGFSATEAALEGFRVTRENPKAFGVWVIVSFAISVLGVVIDGFMPGSIKAGLDAINAEEVLTPQQFVDTLILIAPILVLGLAVLSVMAAAVYRLIFRHDDTRFGYLRLGADELRLMGLTVIFMGIAIGLVVSVGMAVGVLVVLISTVVPAAATFASLVGTVFSFGVIIYVLVRLSLAPVATFAERRLAIFESWTLTRGQFWPLFSAYFLAVICIIAVGVLLMTVFAGVAGAVALMMGRQLSDVKAIFAADGANLRSHLSIGVIAYAIVNSVLSALYNAVIAAPGAVAYRDLHGWPPAQPLSVQPEAG